VISPYTVTFRTYTLKVINLLPRYDLMLSAICLVFTLCYISLSILCIRTTDIHISSIFFRQLACRVGLQYLFAVVGRSEVRSTEMSFIVSLSLGIYNAGFLKGISPYCPLFICARM
jgi:hypothetical protein